MHNKITMLINEQGLMTHRHASFNDLKIPVSERNIHWSLGARALEHASLTELALLLFCIINYSNKIK